MQLKNSLPRSQKTPLEREALTFARQALVDWVVNAHGEQDSVLLTIQIEHVTTQEELIEVLDKVCLAMQDKQSTHQINVQRKQVMEMLKLERTVLASKSQSSAKP
jgi:hypothetical protein